MEPNSFLLWVSVTSISFNSHLCLLWVPFQCCVSQLRYFQTEHSFSNGFLICKWLVSQTMEESFFAVFSPSSLTPHDSDNGGGGGCHEWGWGWGSCPQAGAATVWCRGCWGGTGRQQLVKLTYGHQEQAADLEQIRSWVVTQLTLIFAAAF